MNNYSYNSCHKQLSILVRKRSKDLDYCSLQTTPSTTTPKTSGSHQNAYEKVVYNAATSFLSQQAGSNKKNEKPTFKLGNQKTGWGAKSAGLAKPQQLHYCEVCKISCAGPQVCNYSLHLFS